jgi:aminoglycoside phosphotransferase family enzyme/predicted kinase
MGTRGQSCCNNCFIDGEPVNQTVEMLKALSSYEQRTTTVELIETHISWVFVTDRYAYKLKKPVSFEFVDFSSPELRRWACQEEVRLNRRLAPNVYLGVVPITREADGKLALNGQGEEIDWLVQMRRLPRESAMDVLLKEGRLRPEHLKAVAKHLTRFYINLPPVPLEPSDYRQSLERHIRANGETLLENLTELGESVRRIQSAQLRYLHLQEELLDQRVVEGRVVDGHGDLRPEHIYFDPEPTIIDCIEFSEELRTVDVADELSFLFMECERLRHGTLSNVVLAEYQRASGDEIPPTLLAFYRSYRALVRAKVAVLRKQQIQPQAELPEDELVAQYLQLAEQYAAELGPPSMLIVGGLMGTGKSTLASHLANACAIELLSTDRIRHALFGPSKIPAPYGGGHYQPAMREQVYDELFRQASELLKKGQSVVLDGTFLTSGLRERAFDLAYRHGAVSLYVHCTCPRSVAYQRIQQRVAGRQSESEARTELYDLQARDFEPPFADDPAVTIDTTKSITEQKRLVFQELRRLLTEKVVSQVGSANR